MHAVILAGGRGARLRPYTTSLPKPLVPIGARYAILEIVLTQLADQGFTSVTLAIGNLGHLIRSFVGDGSRWRLEVDTSWRSTRWAPLALDWACSTGSLTTCSS